MSSFHDVHAVHYDWQSVLRRRIINSSPPWIVQFKSAFVCSASTKNHWAKHTQKRQLRKIYLHPCAVKSTKSSSFPVSTDTLKKNRPSVSLEYLSTGERKFHVVTSIVTHPCNGVRRLREITMMIHVFTCHHVLLRRTSVSITQRTSRRRDFVHASHDVGDIVIFRVWVERLVSCWSFWKITKVRSEMIWWDRKVQEECAKRIPTSLAYLSYTITSRRKSGRLCIDLSMMEQERKTYSGSLCTDISWRSRCAKECTKQIPTASTERRSWNVSPVWVRWSDPSGNWWSDPSKTREWVSSFTVILRDDIISLSSSKKKSVRDFHYELHLGSCAWLSDVCDIQSSGFDFEGRLSNVTQIQCQKMLWKTRVSLVRVRILGCLMITALICSWRSYDLESLTPSEHPDWQS